MRWFLVSAALVILGTIILVSFASQAFDEMHLKKLKALNACKNCDLSEANMRYAKLSEANLNGAILCKTKTPWGKKNSGCKIKD